MFTYIRRSILLLGLLLGISHSAFAIAPATRNVPGTYATIQAAVTAAAVGDTVLVAPGTYTGAGNFDISFGGKDITVMSSAGAATTIIDCQGSASTLRRAFVLTGGETIASVIQGFTIQNGYQVTGGGAVQISGTATIFSGVTIRQCVFKNNRGFQGGAIFMSSSTSTVTQCDFIGNSTDSATSPSQSYGGAIEVTKNNSNTNTVNINNCVFRGNSSKAEGGAIDMASNNANQTVKVFNCSFYGNITTTANTGTIDFFNGTNSVQNCIFWGNTSPKEISTASPPAVGVIRYCDVNQTGYAGVNNNISSDPKYIDAANGNLKLGTNSPCIGAGTATGAPAVDHDGVTWTGNVSMGAYNGIALVAPTFIASGAGTLNISQNASAQNLKALLHVSDTDSAQTLTWSQSSAPSHGSLAFSGATATSGSSDITPGGTITYTPTTGYSGSDSFIVQVSDGSGSATRTINVTITDSVAPLLTLVTIASNNANSSRAKIGNTVTITFTANEPIGAPTVTIAGQTATVSNVSGNQWKGVYTMGTGAASGTVGFSIAFSDLAANAGTPVSATTNSSSVTFDSIAPAVSISAPSTSLTSSGPVSYLVTYSDANLGTVTLSAIDIIVNTNGPIVNSISVSGSGATRTVTIEAITGNGTVGISIPAGTATDLAGNSATASTPSATTAVDNSKPTIAISAPSISSTAAGPVTYTVTYGDANFASSTLSSGNITLNATGNAAATVGVSGSGVTRTVTLSAISGNGTLGISIAANSAVDSVGNSALASGRSTTFTVINMPPIITPGAVTASVLTFDGSSQSVDAATGIALANSSFTIEFWAKRGTIGTLQTAISEGALNALLIGFGPNNTFTFGFNNEVLTTAAAYTDGAWHHWACSYDATNLARKIYRDGVLVANNTAAAHFQGAGRFVIGSNGGISAFYNGVLADVRVWSVARSQSEIKDAMFNSPVGNESGLTAYWPLDEGEGTTAIDIAVGHANPGTVANGNGWLTASTSFGPVFVEVGTSFTDPGATALDAFGNSLSVTASNNVLINTPGFYEAVYSATDPVNGLATVTRRAVEVADTTAPAAPEILVPVNGSTMNGASTTISGNAESGSTVTVTITGGTSPLVLSGVTDGSGHFSIAPVVLVDGVYQATAMARDVSGNSSASLPPTVFTQGSGPVLQNGILITKGGYALDRATGLFVQTLTLKNTSAVAIQGPVYLLIDTLSPNATLFNATGVTSATSTPYILVSASTLAAGASKTVVLRFANPTKAGITYGSRTFSGGTIAP